MKSTRRPISDLSEIIEFHVDSTSSDPNLGGPIEVQCTPTKISVRFLGERTWITIEWWEMLFIAGCHGKYSELLGELRSKAWEEGFKLGLDERCNSIDDAEAAMGDKLVRMPKNKMTGGVPFTPSA